MFLWFVSGRGGGDLSQKPSPGGSEPRQPEKIQVAAGKTFGNKSTVNS